MKNLLKYFPLCIIALLPGSFTLVAQDSKIMAGNMLNFAGVLMYSDSVKTSDPAWDVIEKVHPNLPLLEAKTLAFVSGIVNSSLSESVKEAALFVEVVSGEIPVSRWVVSGEKIEVR